ncbi:hypothetical protein ED28_16170 [[Pantoea] beijingensis]|uniref:Uncharacterized protein n=1 Tax=[Pantoea] beijingensis TaxID=1324864 RepID=A0A443IA71_9GAMM|nr:MULTISPECIES: type III secretion system HrpP C-terminal domain-containing protein [Erwiniaceae]RWR00984.1 hypothetical protein ED28_16170 [[Pantoea] beijingensis]
MHRPIQHSLPPTAHTQQHHDHENREEAQAKNRPNPAFANNKPNALIQPRNPLPGPLSAQHSGRSSTASRSADKHHLNRDKNDFASLLSGDNEAAMPILPVMLADNHSGENFRSMLSEASEAGASAPTPPCWQIVEPTLTEEIDKQPTFPATFSMLLPQLGEVNAQVNQINSGELDIALAFKRSSFDAVRGSQNSCGRSLSQRMGKRVHLSFNLQDERYQDNMQDKWS